MEQQEETQQPQEGQNVPAPIAPKKHEPEKPSQDWASVARSVVQVVGIAVERFGWPGTCLLFGMYFIERHSTDEQKQRLIDLYVLGNGIGSAWPIILLSLVYIATLYAQKKHYERIVKEHQKRLSEVADEKGRLQEAGAGKNLRHANKRK